MEINNKQLIGIGFIFVLFVGWLSYVSVQNLPKPSREEVNKSIQYAIKDTPYFEDRRLIEETLKDLKRDVKELSFELHKLRLMISKHYKTGDTP